MKTTYEAGSRIFKSSKDNITHCVLFANGNIAAKCSSLELAEKAKAKDERVHNLKGLTIVVAVKL